jgi:glycosyltransferase involved in cell wall biosynthesis
MDYRLGVVAFCSDTGLGTQTRAYCKYLNPVKVMVVDLSPLNHMSIHPEWYPDAWRVVKGIPAPKDCDEFLEDLDCILLAETPLSYHLFEAARRKGIASILVYNFEFLDYLNQPHLPRPTLLAAPSTWNIERVRQLGMPVVELPVPVDAGQLPQRTITKATRFFHIAGRPAVHDRNGTLHFIEAAKLAAQHEPLEFTLYCQQPSEVMRRALRGSTIKLVEHVTDSADLYRDGDVLVMPRRYGGLCLPVNEAISCGIPVLMPDVSPNNDWLPSDWLLPTTRRTYQFMAHTPVDVHSVLVPAVAQKMLDLYRHPDAVECMHEQAKALAGELSWERLKPRYEEVIERAIKEVRNG